MAYIVSMYNLVLSTANTTTKTTTIMKAIHQRKNKLTPRSVIDYITDIHVFIPVVVPITP